MADSRAHGPDVQHSYFVPMVDMLAGVVFILVILLASMTLVSRDEFAQAEAAEAEIARIHAELEEARAMERQFLEPRRKAEAAMRLLLDRLAGHLKASNVASSIDADGGRLTIAAHDVFSPGTAALTPTGRTIGLALSRALATELPCLDSGPGRKRAGCVAYGDVRLSQGRLALNNGPGQAEAGDLSVARALVLLAEVAARSPEIAGLAAPDGGRLLSHGSFTTIAPAEAPGGAPEADGTDTIVLAFEMQLPALPNVP